ncbi:hypothetical protein Spla01_04996 [Streptomyces platensis]
MFRPAVPFQREPLRAWGGELRDESGRPVIEHVGAQLCGHRVALADVRQHPERGRKVRTSQHERDLSAENRAAGRAIASDREPYEFVCVHPPADRDQDLTAGPGLREPVGRHGVHAARGDHAVIRAALLVARQAVTDHAGRPVSGAREGHSGTGGHLGVNLDRGHGVLADDMAEQRG